MDLGQLGVWKPVGLFVLEQLKTRMGLIRKRKTNKKAAASRKPVRAVADAPDRVLGAVLGQRQSDSPADLPKGDLGGGSRENLQGS